jgi:hypothetical protein
MQYDDLLEKYLLGISLLENAISPLTNDQIEYLPKRADSWSIHEHIIHIVDCELHLFIKIKSIIAQPHSTGYALDSGTWAQNIKGKNEDSRKYLQLFPILRQIIVDLIKNEPDSTWNDYLIWPYHGENRKATLIDCIDSGIRHIDFHLNYIKMNIEEYSKNSQ